MKVDPSVCLNRRQLLGAAAIGASGLAANMAQVELLSQPAFLSFLFSTSLTAFCGLKFSPVFSHSPVCLFLNY